MAAGSDPPEAGAVLAKAAGRSATWLGLTTSELCSVLEVNDPESTLQPGSTAWYNALALIRLAKDLERLLSSQDAARSWLRLPNTALGSRPIESLRQTGGLSRVLDYTSGYLSR